MHDALPISLPREQIDAFCRRNHIRRLALFGSVLRTDFRPDSDLDVLVEFEPGTRIGLLGLERLQSELSAILKRKVDLNTAGFLSKSFRDDVLREARTIHAAA